jgi:hypothetical protein
LQAQGLLQNPLSHKSLKIADDIFKTHLYVTTAEVLIKNYQPYIEDELDAWQMANSLVAFTRKEHPDLADRELARLIKQRSEDFHFMMTFFELAVAAE